MVSWRFYLARRRVTDFRLWAAQRGITTVEQLISTLESIGTTVPSDTEIAEFIPVVSSIVSSNTVPVTIEHKDTAFHVHIEPKEHEQHDTPEHRKTSKPKSTPKEKSRK